MSCQLSHRVFARKLRQSWESSSGLSLKGTMRETRGVPLTRWRTRSRPPGVVRTSASSPQRARCCERRYGPGRSPPGRPGAAPAGDRGWRARGRWAPASRRRAGAAPSAPRLRSPPACPRAPRKATARDQEPRGVVALALHVAAPVRLEEGPAPLARCVQAVLVRVEEAGRGAGVEGERHLGEGLGREPVGGLQEGHGLAARRGEGRVEAPAVPEPAGLGTKRIRESWACSAERCPRSSASLGSGPATTSSHGSWVCAHTEAAHSRQCAASTGPATTTTEKVGSWGTGVPAAW